MRTYDLKDFKFYIKDDMAEIQVRDNWGNTIKCSIEDARNVYRAVRAGVLEHHKYKDTFQTLKEVRAFLKK